MNKLENETYLGFAKRATESLQDRMITLEEWSEAILGENIYSAENTRRCARFMAEFFERLDEEDIKVADENKATELIEAKEELIRERKKLQTVNLEAQEYYRERARSELFNEKIENAIRNLAPIEVKTIHHTANETGRTGLIAVSDLHAGSTFEISGLYGEVVNSYDFDIMKARMEKLIGLIEADAIEYDDVVVAICGDLFENALRMTNLMKLKEPVIDTVIKTTEFLCQWIAEIANTLEAPVKVITIGGNHDQIPMLGMKPRPEEENLTKIAVKFMELRFEGNDNIKIEPYAETTVVNIQGVNVMFDHGTDSDVASTVEYFSNIYNIDIDEAIVGHLHRSESKGIGITELGDKMIYRVGSIVGIDPYAKKIRKSARPSAYFALYESDNGHTWSRNYYL